MRLLHGTACLFPAVHNLVAPHLVPRLPIPSASPLLSIQPLSRRRRAFTTSQTHLSSLVPSPLSRHDRPYLQPSRELVSLSHSSINRIPVSQPVRAYETTFASSPRLFALSFTNHSHRSRLAARSNQRTFRVDRSCRKPPFSTQTPVKHNASSLWRFQNSTAQAGPAVSACTAHSWMCADLRV